MQTSLRLMSFITLTIFTIFTACKKDAESSTDPANELSTHSDDQFRVSSEMDAVTNDANIAVESNTTFSGRLQNPTGIICDGKIEFNTASKPRKITITYDGTNCSGMQIRTGAVVISIDSGVHWRDAGAVMTVEYQNLKVKRLSDNKSITINGTQTITNVSGGRLIDLVSQNNITHTTSSSNMAITFDDGSQRTWNIARKRVFTYHNGVILTVTGTHTDGNKSNIAEWGTNRFGNTFTTSITQPLVIRQDCNFRLTGGQVLHDRLATTAEVAFGLDKDGNPTSCPATGSYYYKLSWTGPGGNTRNIILPY